MKFRLSIFIVTGFLLLITTSGSAQAAEDLTRDGICKADIQKFCRNVKSGKGRILKCMRQYERHLSGACREHIAVVREKTPAFAKACKKDVQHFCSHIRLGQGDVYRCLKQYPAEISAKCANLVK